MYFDPAFVAGLDSSSSLEEVAGILLEWVVWALWLQEEAWSQMVGVDCIETRMAGNCREVHSWNINVVLMGQKWEEAG